VQIAGKGHHKFIVFYDVRGAEAARCVLKRSENSDKRGKMEHSNSTGNNRYIIRPYFAHLFSSVVF
jgi:hypothetical protein